MSDDDWENFDVEDIQRGSDYSDEEFIESEDEAPGDGPPRPRKKKKPEINITDKYDEVKYTNIDQISALAHTCAEKFAEAKKHQPALVELAAKMMHEMLKTFGERLTLQTLESAKGNLQKVQKTMRLERIQKQQAKAAGDKHTIAQKGAKIDVNDVLAEVYGDATEHADAEWDENGWYDEAGNWVEGKGYYDEEGNWVDEAAEEEKKEGKQQQQQQPAASSSSSKPGLATIAEDAFPSLGGDSTGGDAFPSLGGGPAAKKTNDFPSLGGGKKAEPKGVWGK